ncbi:MAG: AbiH family protein [Saprospiraceae bacterium]
MLRLILIGNGFDLAHGLKTKYEDFIYDLIDLQITDPHLSPTIFTSTHELKGHKDFFSVLKDPSGVKTGHFRPSNYITFQNKFFELVISNYSSKNWCDIEELYFQELLKCEYVSRIERLNQDFEIIKNHLGVYLKKATQILKTTTIDPIYYLLKRFSNFIPGDTLILNFNYTNTLGSYLSQIPNIDLINIHGEIDNPENPIIFGFAAEEDIITSLLEKGSHEWLRNIKDNCYKESDNFDKLEKFLNSGQYIDVFILGHSCGYSDNLILRQIFNGPKVHKVRLFYYQSIENFRKSLYNIQRIMKDYSQFRKIVNFKESIHIPQADDNETLNRNFEDFVDKVLQ